MYAVRTHPRRQIRVGGDQELEAAPPARARQSAANTGAVRGAEMTIDNNAAARQRFGHAERGECARWIGKKEQRRDWRRTGLAVEPARFSR